MDDTSWQDKCGGSTWQPPLRGMGYFNNSLNVQHQRSALNGGVPEPILLNNLNKTDSSGLGNSCLGILSVPSSLVQCDTQPIGNAAELAISAHVVTNSSGKGAVPQMNLPLSANLGNRNDKNGCFTPSFISSEQLGLDNRRGRAGTSPVFSTGELFSSDYIEATVTCNDLQTSNINLPSSDLARAADHRIVPGFEIGMQFSSPLDGQLAGFNMANIGVLQSTNFQQLDKSPSGADTSISNQTNTFPSACPRVYCLSKSGSLLLSNTGLLGVVCLCHSMHMSVSKFCEHSGLHAINPGEAVHMDNGMTIARWRKLYSQKFAIRAPEDQSGWDWPQWYSINADLVKSGSGLSNMSNSYDLSSSPRGFVMSGEPGENASYPTKVYSSENLPKRVQHRDNQDECNFSSKSLTVTSRHSSHSRLIGCPLPRYSTMPKFVGNRDSENSLPSASVYSDSLSKFGPSFNSHPPLQYLKTPDKLSNSRNFNNSTGGQILDRDIVSSNIELKLGQPYQQGQTFGNPLQSSTGRQLLDTLGSPLKPVSSVHLIVNKDNAMVLEKNRQYPWYAASTSNSRERTGKIELNIMNYAFQNNNAAALAQLRNDATLAQDGLLKGDVKAPANNLMGISTVSTAARKQHSNFHVAKSSPSAANPLNCDPSLERLCMVNEISTSGQVHNEVSGGFSFLSKLGYGSQRNSCLSCGTDGEIGNLSGFTLHGKNCYSYQLSGLSLNASDAQNNLNYSGIVPCSGNSRQKDVSLPRSSNSTLVSSSRLILPPSEVSMGFSSAGSVISSLIPSLSSKETFDGNSCTVNEDLRMLAAKHMSERVPGLGFTSVGENPEMERLSSLSYAKKLVIDPSTSLEQRRDVNSTNQMDFSEAPLKSLNFNATSRTSDMQKLNPVAGSTNCRNVSSSSQEFPLSSKEAGIPPQDSHDLFVIKPISRRLEASQSNILSSYENKSILKALTSCFNSNCSCPHEKSCPASYCDRIGETSLGALRKQIVGDSHKASLGLAENIMDHGAPTNKDISLEEKRKIDGQTSKNIGFHTFQWKDVPNKAKKVCNLTSIEHPANQLNDKRINGNHDVDSASTKYYVKSVQEVGTFNVSNISSGSSAPAITQDSTEVNNTGSYTMNAQDPGQMNDGILDEGSGIDKYWSSDVDNSHDRGRTDDFSSCKSISRKERSLKALTNQASCTLMSERKLMDQNVLSGLPLRDKSNYPQMNERSLKLRKRKRVKWKILDASVPGTGLVSVSPRSRRSAKWFSGTTKDKILPSDQGITNLCIAASMGCKFERPSLHPAKATLKRKIERACHLGEEVDCEANHVDLKKSKVSCFKRCRHDSFTDSFEQFKAEESDCYDSATTGTVKEVNYKKVSSSKEMNISNRNAKPVALGKFGMISSEKFPLEGSRPAKIVSLSKILKNAKRCTLHEDNRSNTCSTMVLKKALNQCSGRLIHLKEKECENDKYGGSSMEDIYNACFSREKEHTAKLFVSKNEASVGSLKIEDTSNYNGSNGFKCKSVDICERRSCDLTINGTTREHSSSAVDSPFIWSSALKQRKNYRSVGKLLRRKDDGKCHNTKSCTSNAKKSNKDYQSRSLSNSEELCCVCGSSKKDQMNCLIECGRCFIRVHQGCYGVPKVPKDLWYCRPCKTGSVNMICVLCGYGGGAMTRALQSQNNVKSLLRNLDVDMDSKPNEGSLSNLKVDNQARMLDSSVKQWVHMVCGLWTPGTQCPNVNTMSSFNVSGAFKLGASGVCSLCSRAGGSCIQCRVENCSVRFHPWCAHQKGLLQSEIDNVHDGSVGFFGTCALHAMHPLHESDGEPLITDTCPDNDDITCARTEGYKGRKRDGVSHNLHQPYGKGKCLVLQEQLNAWLHINKKKLSTKGLLPISDVDNDCRKEYVRYKQRKGWKNLVVYKSGIHALGIYTSRFICRGAMVVEYVGEIVGLRVSDKRENEYQSGKRLQYKSACYFFKIDKEYVIDATRKGGIGRFVNHSCLPNCVAKVITVRNEKKVVFFAERDIYPGEEITYDYHFNNEDEGKKIPCFCKSINCRRYLN